MTESLHPEGSLRPDAPEEDLVRYPVLHPPAAEPDRHWRTEGGRTHNEIMGMRRRASMRWPTGQARAPAATQAPIWSDRDLDPEGGPVDRLRGELARWRRDGYPGASHCTQVFLRHLASGAEREGTHNLFFAQREAIETVVFLTEVCPDTHWMIRDLKDMAERYSHGLMRLALRMATGTGKTAVMACLIAWYAINRGRGRAFGKGLARNVDRVIVVCPGSTIRERLACLDPRRPDNLYDEWQLLPEELRPRLNGVDVHVTNFERLQPRDSPGRAGMELGRQSGLKARELQAIMGPGGQGDRETHEEMWTRTLRLDRRSSRRRRAVVLNDEGHHCWCRKESERPGIWMTALQALRNHPQLQLAQVIDVSATPMFINPARTLGLASGRRESDLFPWVVSEYALAEAMESGLVKMPCLPDADAGTSERMLRNLFDENSGRPLDSEAGMELVRQGARLLYQDYRKRFRRWTAQEDSRRGEPVYIAVTNTKRNAEALFRMLGGYRAADGRLVASEGFKLFENLPPAESPEAEGPMRTILVVSKTFNPASEGAGGLDRITGQLGIRAAGAPEPTDEEIQRVLQTVGQPGQPGGSVRCVVSVGMLTEGWDCQRVTNILGYRKFGSQLLCEQVLGRALRRRDYDNRIQVRRMGAEEATDRYKAEYATVIGVPFEPWPTDGETDIAVPPPKTLVHPVAGRAEEFAIWVPQFEEYRLESRPGTLELRPEHVRAPEHDPDQAAPVIGAVMLRGPFGPGAMVGTNRRKSARNGVWLLAAELARRFQHRGGDQADGMRPRQALLFADCLRIIEQWMRDIAPAGWDAARLLDPAAREAAVPAILPGLRMSGGEVKRVGVPRDRNRPMRSASTWSPFETLLQDVAKLEHSELNVAACHSQLERQIAEQLDRSPLVAAVTRNHGPQRIEIPYRYRGAHVRYVPDFFLRLQPRASDGRIPHVALEVKGNPDPRSRRKALWTREWWVPAADDLGQGRQQAWLFVEVGPDGDPELAIQAELEQRGLA